MGASFLRRRLMDSRLDGSVAARLRRKRIRLFTTLLEEVPRPTSILDVGGEQAFWERLGLADDTSVQFHILNLASQLTTRPNFHFVHGDARAVPAAAGEYDVVFSNAVLHMVGTSEDQRRMASEVIRVGKRYFVQCPSRWFPVHPHFMFPFFQFLPLGIQVRLLEHLPLTHLRVKLSRTDWERFCRSIRLPTKRDMLRMFPGASIRRERVLGWTKSYIACGGWSAGRSPAGPGQTSQ